MFSLVESCSFTGYSEFLNKLNSQMVFKKSLKSFQQQRKKNSLCTFLLYERHVFGFFGSIFGSTNFDAQFHNQGTEASRSKQRFFFFSKSDLNYFLSCVQDLKKCQKFQLEETRSVLSTVIQQIFFQEIFFSWVKPKKRGKFE